MIKRYRKVVPVRESTTNKEVAKMVASKLGITNPGDYVLVKIKDGEGTIKLKLTDFVGQLFYSSQNLVLNSIVHYSFQKKHVWTATWFQTT